MMVVREIDKDDLEKSLKLLDQLEVGWVLFDPKRSPMEVVGEYNTKADAVDALLFSLFKGTYCQFTAVPHLKEQLIETKRIMLQDGREVGRLAIHCWDTDVDLERKMEIKYTNAQGFNYISDGNILPAQYQTMSYFTRKDNNFLLTKDETLITKNLNIMAYQRIEKVLDQVKFAGFGDALETKLRERMNSGEKNIAESYKPDFNIPTEAVVNLQLSDKGNYFFNSYDIIVRKEKDVPLKQTIYINGPQQAADGNWVNSNITLKEAANMMDLNDKGQGRSVMKNYVNAEGGEYKAWTRFDFTQVDKYGNFPTVKRPDFDLGKKLADFGYHAVSKEQLESLHKGNPTTLTANINGAEVRQAVFVNADFKTISNYGKPHGLVKSEGQSTTTGKTQSNDVNGDGEPSKKQSRSRQEKPGTDEDGAPTEQKQTRKKRGVKQ